MARRRQRYVFYSERPVHPIRRFFGWMFGILAALLILCITANFIIRNQVELQTVRVTVQSLHPDIENWSILHISDLHGQQIGERQSGIRTALGGTRYSCVVFTGDMCGKDGDVSALLDLLALMPNDVPKLLVPGDEDPPVIATEAHASLSVWSDWAQRLIDAGVTIVDEPTAVTRGKHTLWFVPEYVFSLDLDSMETAYQAQLDSLSGEDVLLHPDDSARKRACEYQLEKIQRIREVRKGFAVNDVLITLTHTPVTSAYVNTMLGWTGKDEPFSLRHSDLILAGHYCAGQWRLPGLGAICVPELGWFPEDRLISGFSYVSGIPQYISPGLGASSVYGWRRQRFFNHPAVTMIYLTAKMT